MTAVVNTEVCFISLIRVNDIFSL